MGSQIVPARVALVQPNTSMLFQRYGRGESYSEMLELHQLLFGRSDLYELVPETYFLDGRASFEQSDVVILPYATYFPARMAERLAAWVRKGGLLVGAGPFGLYDPYGFDRPELWKEIFTRVPAPASQPGAAEWRWALDGQSGLIEGRLGRGTVLVALRSLGDREFRAGAGPRILAAIEAKARRPAWSTVDDFEIMVRSASDGQRYLAVINRNVDQPASGSIALEGRWTRGVDLDVPGGFPVPFRAKGEHTEFSLRLEPAEFTLIRLER